MREVLSLGVDLGGTKTGDLVIKVVSEDGRTIRIDGVVALKKG